MSCDPAMCLALRDGGFPASGLMPLGSAAADPLGSSVIAETAALRSQFGPRLASVYAPVVIASFGSGAARVDIRAYAAGSAADYRAALAADAAARRAAGQRLLGNPHFAAVAAARRELAAGRVDSRLLITLAALAARHGVLVESFGSADPHGDPLMPVRSADLAVPQAGPARGAYLQSVLAVLRAQRSPATAARTRLAGAGAAAVLQIGFAAPTPIGLLDRKHR